MLSVSNYMTHIYHNFTRLGSILILSRKHLRMCMIYDVRKHMKSSFSYVWDFLVLKTCHVYSFQTYGSYVCFPQTYGSYVCKQNNHFHTFGIFVLISYDSYVSEISNSDRVLDYLKWPSLVNRQEPR